MQSSHSLHSLCLVSVFEFNSKFFFFFQNRDRNFKSQGKILSNFKCGKVLSI